MRVVGEIRPEKLETLKKATTIVEGVLAEHKPSQYFAAIIDNEEAPAEPSTSHVQETVARLLNVPSRNVHVKIFRDKATGVKGGERRYGKIVGIKAETVEGEAFQADILKLVSLQAKITSENPTITRVLYTVRENPEKKPYVISIRAVQTKDF